MEQIITIGELAEILNIEEVLKQNGVSPEDKAEVKISNRTLTVRSSNEDERAEKLDVLARKLFEKRRDAYLELTKRAQQTGVCGL